MKIGAHVSIAGGIDKAPKRIKDLGGNCLQIFSKNPRGWKASELSEDVAEAAKENLRKYDLDPMVVHISYLVNLASPKKDLHEKSMKSFQLELERTGLVGGKYLVLHPGKYTGSTVEEGIKRIGESINESFESVDNQVMLLLENVAGAGTEIGKTFEELQQIIDLIEEKERVGICFDTCHGFAAGYDLRNEDAVDKVFTQFDQVIGFDKLRVIHTNDAKAGLGSSKDRHEHIGLGEIGEAGFKAMLHHPLIRKHDVPFILETPEDDERGFKENIQKLKELAE